LQKVLKVLKFTQVYALNIWDNVLPRRSVYEWTCTLKNGWKSVKDAERSERPSTSTTDEKQEDAAAITLADRRLTTEEIELQLGVSQDTTYSLVFDIFGFRKLSAKWVPKHITEEYKGNRQDIYCSLLRCNREGDNFLNGIITRVETRMHHYETGIKRQSIQWKHTSSSS
jgi:hypothetical protein